jgi:hypothetical protein
MSMENKEADKLICELYRDKIREGEQSGFVDPVVIDVVRTILSRSGQRKKEYGKDLTRDDYSPLDWLNEAQTEAMDFTLYLQRIKRDYEIFLSIIRTTPNNYELGYKIRKIYGD